eukprot:514927-Prymnesium_polylepis.2
MLVAVVVPDFETLLPFAKTQGWPTEDRVALAGSDNVKTLLKAEVKRIPQKRNSRAGAKGLGGRGGEAECDVHRPRRRRHETYVDSGRRQATKPGPEQAFAAGNAARGKTKRKKVRNRALRPTMHAASRLPRVISSLHVIVYQQERCTPKRMQSLACKNWLRACHFGNGRAAAARLLGGERAYRVCGGAGWLLNEARHVVRTVNVYST